MNWTNIKRWAKDKGYTCVREKTTDESNPNEYDYYWAANNDIDATGVSISVSKLATDIYNHITDNKHLEHQRTDKREMENDQIQSNYGLR